MKRRSERMRKDLGPLAGAPEEAAAKRLEVTPFLDACRALPDVDSEKVRRARKLIENDGYPSEEVLQMIAKQLARNWPTPPSKPKQDL